jgi:hypothetical protein
MAKNPAQFALDYAQLRARLSAFAAERDALREQRNRFHKLWKEAKGESSAALDLVEPIAARCAAAEARMEAAADSFLRIEEIDDGHWGEERTTAALKVGEMARIAFAARRALAALPERKEDEEPATLARIAHDLHCDADCATDDTTFCTRRLSHGGPHMAVTLDGIFVEWRKSTAALPVPETQP